MKYIYFYSIVFICVFIFHQANSQIQVFPPEPLQPSPITQKMNLPEKRFVPSTKRWNLIWSDQIIPSNVTPKKVEFAAKNYIGTQKIFASQASDFRNFNNNFLILSYHLAAGLNPEFNSDCPDPKNNTGNGFIGVVTPMGYINEFAFYLRPWLNNNNIAESSATFDNMFQHFDRFDKSSRVWHNDPYWLMNLEDDNWKKHHTN